MAIITDVWFTHEEGALAGTLGALPTLDVRNLQEVSTDPERNVYFFRFDGPSLETIRAALDDDPTVRAVRRMPEFDDQRLLGVEFEPETKLLAPEVTRVGGYVLDARGRSGGRRAPGWYERWSLPEPESLHTIWQDAREDGFDFEIIEVNRHGATSGETVAPETLTAQQRSALVAAYEAGYFAEPRRTSLAELADQLDISPSAVSGRIKRGMKALVGTTLAVDEVDAARSTRSRHRRRPRGDGERRNR